MSTRRSNLNYNRDFRPSRWLALLRIYLGVIFLILGLPKLSAEFRATWPDRLAVLAAQSVPSLYRYFLASVIIPRAEAIIWILIAGEIIVGFCYVLGLFTRLTTMLAAIITVNYLMAFGYLGWAYIVLALTFLLVELAMGGARSGRVWGIDGALYRHTIFKYLS